MQTLSALQHSEFCILNYSQRGISLPRRDPVYRRGMRTARICAAMFVLVLPGIAAAQQAAPSGAAVYNQSCASCH